jgi:hypothetical protein
VARVRMVWQGCVEGADGVARVWMTWQGCWLVKVWRGVGVDDVVRAR